MVVNSNDRIIRSYTIDYSKTIPSIQLVLKFSDMVERTQWLECGISSDSEYIFGARESGHRHDIYLWDKASGVLAKMVEGPPEGLTDITVFFLN